MELTCAALLTDNYLVWQRSLGQVRKVKEYAEYLGIHEVTLNQLINGKKQPTDKMLIKLALKTGDIRFYDVNNLPHPDLNLKVLTTNWEFMPLERQKEIKEESERFRVEHETRNITDRREPDLHL